MRVIVATYEHKHGTDTRVFSTAERAAAWKQSIADDYWSDYMEGEKPADRAEMATQYFEFHGAEGFECEYFNTEEMEVDWQI